MKGLIVAVISLGFIALAECYTAEELAMYKQMMSSCVESTGIAESVALKIENDGIYMDDPKMPSYAFCMMKTSGFMDDNGGYLLEDMQEIIGKDVGVDVAKQAVQDCATFTGDKLAKAVELAKCLQEKAYHE